MIKLIISSKMILTKLLTNRTVPLMTRVTQARLFSAEAVKKAENVSENPKEGKFDYTKMDYY
jgi:hypothetical protein